MGLQLAALSLRERPDPDAFLGAFAGTHRYVLDYLSEEVLERQPDQVRTFLLETSILERAQRPALRRGHRPVRRPGHAGGAGARQPVPGPAG